MSTGNTTGVLADKQRGYFQANLVSTIYLTAGQKVDDAIRSTAASMLYGYELDGEPGAPPTIEDAEAFLRDSIAAGTTTIKAWAS